MKTSYHSETESMFIRLSDRPGIECVEFYDRVSFDFDADGELAGIDLDRGSSPPQGLEMLERLPVPAGASTALGSSDD